MSKSELKKMTFEEKLSLVEEIWDDIHNQAQKMKASETHKKLARQRDQSFNPSTAMTWSQVKAKVKKAK